MNELPIKLSQNSYRNFREDPPRIPFCYVFLDYIGPINVKFDDHVSKTYLLITTCLWTRAISLEICFSADTTEFLRVLQMHVCKHGMFSLCLSDLGSQITSGTRLISEFLNDTPCINYFNEHGIERVTFEQYPKGNSSLGSLVETLVKQTKLLIIKSIGKTILHYPEYQLLICKTNHILNRRPIAFKESLRESNTNLLPEPITPEHLLYGREIPSVNIIPALQADYGDEYDESPEVVRREYEKLRSVMEKMTELYHGEFLAQLISQSTDKRDRYKPVTHKIISPGDVVLLVEPLTKRSNYPLGIVKEVNVNTLGEVTSAKVLKGKNGELVFRHATTIIPLLGKEVQDEDSLPTVPPLPDPIPVERPPLRRTAKVARDKITSQYRDGNI